MMRYGEVVTLTCEASMRESKPWSRSANPEKLSSFSIGVLVISDTAISGRAGPAGGPSPPLPFYYRVCVTAVVLFHSEHKRSRKTNENHQKEQQATPRTISVADLSLLPHLEIRPHPNPMVVCWCGWSLLLLKPSSAVQNGEESEGEMKKMLILVFLTFFTFSIHMKRNPHIQCHSKLQVNNGCNHPWRP